MKVLKWKVDLNSDCYIEGEHADRYVQKNAHRQTLCISKGNLTIYI